MNRTLLIGLALALTACGAPSYPLNIAPEPDAAPRTVQVARAVDRDHPSGPLDEVQVRALALQSLVAPSASLQPPPAAVRDFHRAQRALIDDLKADVVGASFVTTHRGDEAYHEICAGVVFVPFDTFLKVFPPAERWGQNLAGYLGGTFKADALDASKRPIRARERMVIATPWYTTGSPDLDMSKHEAITYAKDEVVVHWQVTASENQSVFLDIGYVAFRRHRVNGREATLVVFNSIHRTEPGFLGRAMPSAIRRWLTLQALRGLFMAHIERYREVVETIATEQVTP